MDTDATTVTLCAICGQVIEPDARYFTSDGEPRHMLCEEKIQPHELEYDTRRYLRFLVSDTRKGRLSGNSQGGIKLIAGLDGILDGSRRRPSTWPALVDPNEVLQEVAA